MSDHSTAGPLTVQDLIDLDRDPQPHAMFRALTGFSDEQLRALDDKISAALEVLIPEETFEFTAILVVRSSARRILERRTAQTAYKALLAWSPR